jgi:hypothetical protein
MSRMFHRVLAASVVGAAAMAVPATALAADTGGGGGALPTSVAVRLPAHVTAGQPITVTARVTPDAQSGGSGAQSGGHHGKGHGTKGGGKGAGHGTGHGKGKAKGGTGGTTRHHAVTGEVRFFLDGKAEPPVEVSRDQASEKLRIPLGRHTLVAEYSGDADYLASRSAPIAFALTPGGRSEDPGQDEGPGQGPDGFGPQDPDAPQGPDQGVDQGGQGDQGQDPGRDQGGQDGQGDQDGDQGSDQGGWMPGSGLNTPDGVARA